MREDAGGVRDTAWSALAGLLAGRLAEEGRDPDAPVTVASLCKTLLPYRACRDALGVASKGEYDVALLRFMRDGGVLSLDTELAEAVDRELANPEPGLAFLKNFAAAKVAVRVRHDDRQRGQSAVESEPIDELDELLEVTSAEGVEEAGVAGSEPAAEAGPKMSHTKRTSPERCPECDEVLPGDREVRFCPFCGRDQSLLLCPECSQELTEGWRFCPGCGTAVAGS